MQNYAKNMQKLCKKYAKVSQSLLIFKKLVFFTSNTNWLANPHSNRYEFNTFTLSYLTLIIVEELSF